MRVPDATDDLPEEKSGLLLADIVILYVIVQFAAVCQFHDDEDVVGGIEYLVEFDDILVADEFEYLDLSLDLNEAGSTFEMRFLFFILRLLMILMATFTPVRSCFASEEWDMYISPLRSRPCRLFFLRCNDRCEPIPWVTNICKFK